MISVINLILGGLMVIIGAAIVISNLLSRIRCTVKTDAIVKSLKAEAVKVRDGKQYAYRPKFTYKVNGVEYAGDAPFRAKDSKKYRKGDKLSIAYNPKNPGEFCFVGKQGLMPLGLGLFGAGAVFLLLYYFLG